ncbi:hypothetical protein DYB32_002246 [Aphanomyces invadans]|uniref:EF-hand domain-containing protein n=1 Tax=Aphanomyces invadans TaxID=157072 RepID=A0A418B3X8_9STRA|nr:hypothetical protein DYB32_002246 [Aphanomyces invadans]
MAGMDASAVGDTFTMDNLFHIGLQLPVYSSLLSFVYVIAFVVLIKTLLTQLEVKAAPHPKYFKLVTQMYRGTCFKSLPSRTAHSARLMEFGLFERDSPKYTAWEATDDMILFFAISLTIQSIIMFLRLRARNVQLDELSLLTPSELYAKATENGTSTKIAKPYVSATKMFILRDFFLRQYQLPRLFLFAKYLRAVQDTEIIQLYEVEKSTWVLLVLVQGLYYMLSDYSLASYRDQLADPTIHLAIHKNRLLVLFMLIAALTGGILILLSSRVHRSLSCVLRFSMMWMSASFIGRALLWLDVFLSRPCVVAMMLFLYAYLKKCVTIMVVHAGGDEAQLVSALKHIADSLFERTEHLPEYETESSFAALCATIFRKITGSKWGRKHPTPHLACDLDLPLFSRKAVHVLAKFCLTLNAFYFGFLFQAFMVLVRKVHAWSLGLIVGQLALLLVNMTLLSPRIIRQFALINGIVRVCPGELKQVLEHFTDVLEQQRRMVRAIHHHCHTTGVSLRHMLADLQEADPTKSRYVERDVLRHTIAAYGFKFSKLKFNTFVRLQFKTQGTQVRYDLFYKVLEHEAAALSIEEATIHRAMVRPPHHLHPPKAGDDKAATNDAAQSTTPPANTQEPAHDHQAKSPPISHFV